MIYIASYMLIGLLALITYHHVENKHPAFGDVTRKADFEAIEEAASILLGSVPIPMRCGFFVSRALNIVFNILRWPVLLLDLVRRLTHKTPTDSDKAEVSIAEFKSRGTLWSYMSIQEIEAREKVTDPSGGTPEVAFGHLNPTWLDFKSQLRPGDKIGHYECLPYEVKTSYPWSQGAEGYILVRKDRVVAQVLARSE